MFAVLAGWSSIPPGLTPPVPTICYIPAFPSYAPPPHIDPELAASQNTAQPYYDSSGGTSKLHPAPPPSLLSPRGVLPTYVLQPLQLVSCYPEGHPVLETHHHLSHEGVQTPRLELKKKDCLYQRLK